MSETTNFVSGASGEDAVEWQLPGAVRSTVKTFTLIALVPLSAAIGFVYTRQPIFAFLGPAFLAPVLSRYLVKPSYSLTSETARANWGTSQTEMRWADVRKATVQGSIIHLSPLACDDLRQKFRGVELRLPDEPELRDRIVARIEAGLREGVAIRELDADGKA